MSAINNAYFVVGLMLVLFVMSRGLDKRCMGCGKRIAHAKDCPTRKNLK